MKKNNKNINPITSFEEFKSEISKNELNDSSLHLIYDRVIINTINNASLTREVNPIEIKSDYLTYFLYDDNKDQWVMLKQPRNK